MKVKNAVSCCSFFVCLTSTAGIMLPDITVQDYRDFGENLGKFTPGTTAIPVYKKDGSISEYLAFSMPDLGGVSTKGFSTLISPSYIVSVKHNTGYNDLTFGNEALYAATYNLINRNELSTQDFHTPRLNKVVTDAAPYNTVTKSDFLANYKSRYAWYTRVGAGTQTQVNEDETERVTLSGGYNWKSGGTISAANVQNISTNSYLRYYNLGPDDDDTTPLSIGANAGDSGSPVFAWDEVDHKWKLVAVHRGYDSDSGIYRKRAIAVYIPGDFIASVQQANTSPDVTDGNVNEIISWGNTAIAQGDNVWSWQGLAETYKDKAPSQASIAELDATKDLRFNGDGGTIELENSVNMGAGKLQFSANYSLTSTTGANATWTGGGIEVDAGKEVLWQVNGVANDALHKIGEGTLHINATGINEGSLNTGDGTVILNQQADIYGQKQAFSSVTLVSGRPTVVIADAEQVNSENIFFGYRGGTLDINGNALYFKKINHTDNGATLVNHNSETAASLTLNGFSDKDVTFKTWSYPNKGNVGDIYQYRNPFSEQAEYFQLMTSEYGGYPINQTSTSVWKYLGTNRDIAADMVLKQLNQNVFRGFIGETEEDAINGKLAVNVDQPGAEAKMALTGGMNLNGNLNVKQGTVLLSGQPVAHAGGVVIANDWSTSYFKAEQIVVNKGATFQVGEYANVIADITAGDSSRMMFGYNNSTAGQDKIWRCYAVINSETTSCSQPIRTAAELALLPASSVTGNVSLADNASLYLGKVDYQGHITSAGTTRVTLDTSALWQMTGNSNITTLDALKGSQLSMVSDESWSAKNLQVDTLNATGLTVSLAIKPATAESDKLTIKNAATGDSNILDVSLLLDSSPTVSLLEDVVMVDAPAGTAHDYFTLPDITRGFSLYTPNYVVKETDNRVLWLMQHNAEPTPDAPDETPPQPDVTPSQPDTDPQPSMPSEDEAQSDTNAEPDDTAPGKESAAPPGNPDFNPDDWFTIQDNKKLIHNTRALMASRQYIFNEALSQLNNRASVLRAQPEKSGQWVTIEQSRGSFEGMTANQQTLNVGGDTLRDQQIFGFNASYTLGKAKGNGQQETHNLATVGLYYSWSSPAGWFVDAASRYMHLNQKFSLDPIIGIRDAQRSSNILAGSVKTGYQFTLAEGTFSVSPYIGLSGGYLPGYEMKGDDAQVALSSGLPYFVTSGVTLKKRGIWASNPDVMLTTGLEYQYAPGQTGSSLTLMDSQARREFRAFSDNRYRAHLGIEGKISKNISLGIKSKTSFGGTFKTDYSGIAEINYNF